MQIGSDGGDGDGGMGLCSLPDLIYSMRFVAWDLINYQTGHSWRTVNQMLLTYGYSSIMSIISLLRETTTFHNMCIWLYYLNKWTNQTSWDCLPQYNVFINTISHIMKHLFETSFQLYRKIEEWIKCNVDAFSSKWTLIKF